MTTYLARANLFLACCGQLVYGQTYTLPDVPEVAEMVEYGYLLRQLPDGSFAEPPAAPARRCCGG